MQPDLDFDMSAPRLIDSHCHLHFPAYDADRADVLARMRERQIWGITVGTNIVTSQAGVAFADAHDGIFASVGYHPEHVTSSYKDAQEPHDEDPYDIDRIAEIVASGSKKIVAIGETGLDFYRIDEGRDLQEAAQTQEFALRNHVSLADMHDLPLVIHCRDAFSRLATILKEEKDRGRGVRGVVHCFTGTWEEARPLLDLGFYLSFTGIVTYPPKKTEDPDRSVLRTIERMPLERMLIETDAPWLAPVPYRGKRNEPTHVGYVNECIAGIRHEYPERIAEQTTKNTIDLFRLPVTD